MKKILFISVLFTNYLYASFNTKYNTKLYDDHSNIFDEYGRHEEYISKEKKSEGFINDMKYQYKKLKEEKKLNKEYEERYKKRLEPVIDKQGRIREVKIPDYHMFKHNVYESPYKAKDFTGGWRSIKYGVYLCGATDSEKLQTKINRIMARTALSDYSYSMASAEPNSDGYYTDIYYLQKIYSTEYQGSFGQTYVEDYNRYDYIHDSLSSILTEELKEYYKNPDKDLFNLNNIKYLFEYNAYGEDRMLPKELADKLSNKDRKILIDYYIAMQVRLFGLTNRWGERIIVNKDKIIEFFSDNYVVYVREEEAMKYDKFTIEVPYNIDDLDKPCGLGQKTSKRHDKRFDKIAEKLIKEGKVHVVRAYLKDSLLENE